MLYFNEIDKLTNFLKPEDNIDIEESCKMCKSINIISDYTNSYKLCDDCGCIYQDILDNEQEWRFYGAGDSKSVNPERCGLNIDPLLPKSSMSTIISGGNSNFPSIKRLHYWTTMPSDERSLYIVFKKINEIVDNKLNKKIINQVKMYYKILSEKDILNGYLTRGSVRDAFLAACIFISCKNNNKPLSKSEVAKMCNIKITELTRGLKKFSDLEKNKKLILNKYNDDNIHNYIDRYCDLLNFEKDFIHLTHLIYIRTKKLNLINNSNNLSICGGLLYFISKTFKLKLKKKDIMIHINISEVTMNKIYKIFFNHRKILFIGFETINFLKDDK